MTNERELLRSKMRKWREELSAMHVLEQSVRVCEKVIMLPQYLRASRVFCYHALPLEVQTGGLIREMLRTGREVYLPVMNSDLSMTAMRLRDAEAVHRAGFGIMEPDGEESIEPDKLDLILAPGLAFDGFGGRLGRGRGYFDRFLPLCRAPIVGLALEEQMMDRVPMEAHDCPMDFVITEERIYDCKQARACMV